MYQTVLSKVLFSLLVTAGLLSPTAHGELLIGWHTPMDAGGGDSGEAADPTPDFAATGITGRLGEGNTETGNFNGGFGIQSNHNSEDGTFGTIAIPGIVDPVTETANGARVRNPTNDNQKRLDVSMTNNTGSAIRLDTLHFDYARFGENSPQDLNVFMLSGATDLDLTGFPTVFNVTNDTSTQPAKGDWQDVDADLSILEDNILPDGGNVAIRFQIANAATTFAALSIDNVAISGTILTFLDGDFDMDGDVDGADFLVWQGGEAPSPSDLANWELNYGGSILAVAGISQVPEPTSGTLCLVVAASLASIRIARNRL